MSPEEFRKLCYEEYKRSLSFVDDIYKRFSFALTALVIAGGCHVGLYRDVLWQYFPTRTDVTVFFAALGIGLAAMVYSGVCLALAVFPKPSAQLHSLAAFALWIEAYEKDLVSKDYAPELAKAAATTALGDGITLRLLEAIDMNRKTSMRRLRLFRHCVVALIVAAAALLFVVLTALVLKARGI